jgi:hypothetical protein
MLFEGTELINLETNEITTIQLEDLCGSCIHPNSSKILVDDYWYCVWDPEFWQKYTLVNQ